MTYTLIALLVLLQVADSLTTYRILKGAGYEVNKSLNWLMARIGVIPALLLTKALLVVLIGYVTFCLSVSWWDNALSFLCGWYSLAVALNVGQVKRMP